MIAQTHALSAVTGKMELCTICPTQVSEIDGEIIVDGTPDIDLLAMHDFSLSEEFGFIPRELAEENDPKVRTVDKLRILKSWGEPEKLDPIDRRTECLLAETKRIREDEAKWNQFPTDKEAAQIVLEEPEMAYRLARLMIDIETGNEQRRTNRNMVFVRNSGFKN